MNNIWAKLSTSLFYRVKVCLCFPRIPHRAPQQAQRGWNPALAPPLALYELS